LAAGEAGRTGATDGFGGGGGAGRAPAGAFPAGGGGDGFAAGAGFAPAGGGAGLLTGAAAGADAAAGFAGAGAGLATGAAAFTAAGTDPGAPVASSGVPQRAQNLNVAAFSVMQFGHCFGGAPCWRRGEVDFGGAAMGFCAMVGRLSSSLIGAPQDRQEPTSVSFCAPQRGQSMQGFYDAARRRVKAATP
jgi:hypothetical protein